MRKFFYAFILLLVLVITGCDLQPKIASIPDSVGDFISERYPTLLAEPDSEIYKTAVADYGVYASPTIYGDGDVTGEDYVLYSSADDYMMPAQDTKVELFDTDQSDNEEEADDENDDNYDQDNGYAPDDNVDDLKIPDYVNEKPVVIEKKEIKKEVKSESKISEDVELVRAQLKEITVEKGDTLYSLSRKYSVPVNDLAVMNKISAPFALSIGQKLKVPDVLNIPKEKPEIIRAADKKVASTPKNVNKVELVKTTESVRVKDIKSDSGDKKKVDEPKVASKVEVKPVVTPKETKSDSVDKKKKVESKDQSKVETKKSDVKKTNSEINKKIADKADKVISKSEVDKKNIDKSKVKKDEKVAVKRAEVKQVENKKIEKKDPKKAEKKKDQDNKKTKKTEVKKVDSKKAQPVKRKSQQMVARSSSKFTWPVRGKILSGYGSKSNGLFNDGINIKASRGTAVVAAENGFVAYAGNEVKGMGNLIIIQHADGWMTVYAHMDSMSVRRGHSVKVGQKIGTVGTSGKVDQSQLHFEIRKGTKAYNPVNYLKK